MVFTILPDFLGSRGFIASDSEASKLVLLVRRAIGCPNTILLGEAALRWIAEGFGLVCAPSDTASTVPIL